MQVEGLSRELIQTVLPLCLILPLLLKMVFYRAQHKIFHMMAWFWLALSASVFWGLSYAIGQALLRSLNPLAVVFFNNIFIYTALAVYFTFTHQWPMIFNKFSGNWKVIGTLFAYMSVCLIASILSLKSIHAGNASLTAIIESAYPIFTMLFAYLLLHEKQFNWGTFAGAGLILVGLAVIQLTAS